jgi:hypothetical protein
LSEIKPGLRVHYEFYATASEIGAELHLESDAAKPLAAILKPLEGRALANAPVALKWDPYSVVGYRLDSRLALRPSTSRQPCVKLIQLTREPVARRAATL